MIDLNASMLTPGPDHLESSSRHRRNVNEPIALKPHWLSIFSARIKPDDMHGIENVFGAPPCRKSSVVQYSDMIIAPSPKTTLTCKQEIPIYCPDPWPEHGGQGQTSNEQWVGSKLFPGNGSEIRRGSPDRYSKLERGNLA